MRDRERVEEIRDKQYVVGDGDGLASKRVYDLCAIALRVLEENEDLKARLGVAEMALGFPIIRPHVQRAELVMKENEKLESELTRLREVERAARAFAEPKSHTAQTYEETLDTLRAALADKGASENATKTT